MIPPPTTLAEEGYLADEVSGVVEVVRAKYAAHFRDIRALNQLLTRSQYGLQIHQESAQELTCAALFVRSLAHSQAAIILLERGMASSARAMIRCALEGLFNLGACAADWRTALSFVDSDQVDRKRRAKYLSLVQDPVARAKLDRADLDKILQEVLAKIEEVDAREVKVRDMAKKAGLEDLYLTAYSSLSGAVHSTIGDLDQHFQPDPTHAKLELLPVPNVEDLHGPLLVLGETLVGLVRAASKVFDMAIIDQCESHLSSLHKLYSEPAG